MEDLEEKVDIADLALPSNPVDQNEQKVVSSSIMISDEAVQNYICNSNTSFTYKCNLNQHIAIVH